MGRAPARPRSTLVSGIAGAAALVCAVSLPTLATSPASASAPSADSARGLPAQGTVFTTDFLGKRVIAIAPDGSVTPLMSGFASLGVAVDAAGDVFATDIDAGTVHELSADGTESTVASGFDQPAGLAIDAAGDLYVAWGTYQDDNGAVTEVLPDGTKAPLSFSGLESPGGVAVDQAGDVFVTDYQAGSVVELTSAGVQTTVGSKVYPTSSVAADRSGTIYVPVNTGGLLRRASDGSSSNMVVPGLTYEQFAAVDRAGTLYVSTGGAVGVHRLTTDGTSSTLAPSEQVAALTVYDWSPQQITFTAAPQDPTVGQSYQATASGGGSGKPVVLSTDPTSQGCTVSADGTVTLTHRATCVIDADQAGGGDYTAAPQATQSFAVHRAGQQVRFTSKLPSHPKVGHHYRPAARGGASGHRVTFEVSGACTLKAGLVTFRKPGRCAVLALQKGGADYLPGSARQVVRGITRH